ncbi:Putative SET domain protein [Giardia duodenalis]|uniref:[histone H3]-lysine(4) N-trimethyltransferase n=1 Tax=Giardia intestinalis TaxID=5741 RepID=V6TBA5_GIAIN|nr:Putative SET domain protein [Giardia intestinalis]
MSADYRLRSNPARLQREERAKIAMLHEQSRDFPSSLVGKDLSTLPGSFPAAQSVDECSLLPVFNFPPLPTVTWSPEEGISNSPSKLLGELPVIHRVLTTAEREQLAANPRSSQHLRRELHLGWLQYEPYAPGTDQIGLSEAAQRDGDTITNCTLPMHSFRSSFNLSKMEAMQERVVVFNKVRSIAFSMHEEAAKAVLLYTISLPEGEHLLMHVRMPAVPRLYTILREVLIMVVEDPPPDKFLQSLIGQLDTLKGYRQRSSHFLLIKATLFIMDSLQFYPLSSWADKMQDPSFYECCRRIVSELAASLHTSPTSSHSVPPSESSTYMVMSNQSADTLGSVDVNINDRGTSGSFLSPNLLNHLAEACRLSALLDSLFQTFKIEDGIDACILKEERYANLISQQQKKHRLTQLSYLNFYIMQTRIHRIYASPEKEKAYHCVPTKQLQTGFPHYRQLIKKRNIDALVQVIHKRALSSAKQSPNPKAALMKPRMHRLRGRQSVSDDQMYHYISDIRLPPCYMRCLKTDPVLSSVFRPYPQRTRELFYYRSSIHGFGLFLAEPAQRKELITEYCGDVISSLVADIRERLYAESGLKSVYMFSIKNNYVIDATLKGNFARFLNHSCAPTAESVHARFSASNDALEPVSLISQSQGIAISMLSNLGEGAEVTQNYYLSKESADNKLFCQCGSTRCRLYMN